MKYTSYLFFLLALTLSACSDTQRNSLVKLLSSDASDDSVAIQPEALDDNTYWSYFNGTYQDPTYSGYIKFSMEWDGKGAIRTVIWHPNTFAYHADYLTTLLAYAGLKPAQIDAIALHEQGRQLILGTALSIKDEQMNSDEWDFQFVSSDALPPELIARAIDTLKDHLPRATAAKSFYLPAPEQLSYATRESAAFAAAGVKLAQRASTSDRVCYANGWGVGYVKILNAAQLEAALLEGSIQSDEILVLESIPRELPAVAGIVIASPSSPSSHPALLAQMLGIPYIFEKDALTSANWTRLAATQEPVFFQAENFFGQECQVLVRDGKSLTNDDVLRIRALKKPQPLVLAPYDTGAPSAPVSLDTFGMNDGGRIGAKAANVAELRKLIPNNTITEGLAIPLSSYYQFLAEGKSADGQDLRPQYDALIAKLNAPGIALSSTIPLLTELRTLIEKAKVPARISKEILAEVEATFPRGTRIKLRSSSNIEDLPEFNGAGLYESKGACVGDDSLKGDEAGICEAKPDEVIKALKKVWSSLYLMKAWVARQTFGINEANVGMGVLIQRSFKGELANGVAIAQYPQDTWFGQEGIPDIEVVSTGFPGEEDSVTNPPAGKVPETIRIQKSYMEVVVASTEVPRGQKLLGDEANQSLFSLIETIYRHYEAIRQPSDRRAFVLDLEWKLIETNGQQKIVIKQVRPVPSPSASTQGLGFGTMIIGEQKALLCPTIQEDPDALRKLKLSFPLEISLGLQEIANDESASMTNPIASLKLKADGSTLKMGASTSLTKLPWEAIWATSNEGREVTLSTPFEKHGASYQLNYKIKQTRPVSQPRRLVDGVQSLWTLDFNISQGEQKQDYVLVVGVDSCNADAYQGLTPGAYNASLSYAQTRKPPVPYIERFHSTTDDGLSFDIASQTSFQGFDKTRFLSIESVAIEGILPRTLVLKNRDRAAYAPGHHNFQWSYAFDMDAIEGLTAAEKAELKSRGIETLLLDYPGEQWNAMPTEFVEGENLPEVLPEPIPVEPTFDVYGVDAQGTRALLGKVVRTFRTNSFSIH